jgi:SAM-dependent methyltransferase
VFFHASLHHVRRLERLFRALRLALRPPAAVYVDEYVGPSRGEWRARRLAAAQQMLDQAPTEARITPRIALPIQQDDPSEAIRSGEIPGFLRQHFDLLEWRPYGGQIAALVFPCLDSEWIASPEGLEYVSKMMDLEEEQLRRDPSSTFYLVAYGRLRPHPARLGPSETLHRLAGRARAELRLEPSG